MISLPVLRSVVLLTATPFLAGVCDTARIVVAPEVEQSFSFESGLEGWEAAGTDLIDPPVDWDVSVTGEEAVEGERSVRFRLSNLNDMGKIWIQRPFQLSANQAYEVVVRYRFGTSDAGEVNLWRLLTGVHLDPPVTRGHLTVQGDTGHEGEGPGLVWTEKSFTFQARTAADARLWVSVGVWGTFETERIYYVDDLTVSFTRR